MFSGIVPKDPLIDESVNDRKVRKSVILLGKGDTATPAKIDILMTSKVILEQTTLDQLHQEGILLLTPL